MVNNASFYYQIVPSSGVPIYRQIIDQVKLGIILKKFKPGDFLPSVREVSSSFDVNPMTVSKAYSLLERSGVITFVRGQGMQIPTQSAAGMDRIPPEEEIIPLLEETVNRAQQLSMREENVIQKLKEIWKEKSHE